VHGGVGVSNPLRPRVRNGWIVSMLIINMILWAIMCVGLLFTFAATMHPFALMFSAAFGVGTWWMKRLMLEFHADLEHDTPPRLFRSRRRHAD
jgi:hypothetical protein